VDLMNSFSISSRKWICAGGFGVRDFESALRPQSRSLTWVVNRSDVFQYGSQSKFVETVIVISTSIMACEVRGNIAG